MLILGPQVLPAPRVGTHIILISEDNYQMQGSPALAHYSVKNADSDEVESWDGGTTFSCFA